MARFYRLVRLVLDLLVLCSRRDRSKDVDTRFSTTERTPTPPVIGMEQIEGSDDRWRTARARPTESAGGIPPWLSRALTRVRAVDAILPGDCRCRPAPRDA